MKPTQRILLVDDHVMFLDSLKKRLQDEQDIEVVATCRNADDAIDKSIELNPDVVLMDIDMPGVTCFEAASRIMNRKPDINILFLSGFSNDRYIEQALQVGAAGYITKSESIDSVLDAIRTSAEGNAYYSREIQSRLTFDNDGMRLESYPQSRSSILTTRETEVLCYIAKGMSRKEISETMHLSIHTVHRHTMNIMGKLDIHDRPQLIRFAIREGLVDA